MRAPRWAAGRPGPSGGHFRRRQLIGVPAGDGGRCSIGAEMTSRPFDWLSWRAGAGQKSQSCESSVSLRLAGRSQRGCSCSRNVLALLCRYCCELGRNRVQNENESENENNDDENNNNKYTDGRPHLGRSKLIGRCQYWPREIVSNHRDNNIDGDDDSN
jgi:hypothetical protein